MEERLQRPLGSLLERVRERDETAVRELLELFGPGAREVARAFLHDTALAEDAVQEAFLVAIERLTDLREKAAFPAWLRQIVRTSCARIARRRPRVASLESCGDALAAPRPDEAEVERDETRRLVRGAVAALPSAARETVRLHYLEGRSIAETAERLGVPEGTVKRRLHDARARLADLSLGSSGTLRELVEAPPRDGRPI